MRGCFQGAQRCPPHSRPGVRLGLEPMLVEEKTSGAETRVANLTRPWRRDRHRTTWGWGPRCRGGRSSEEELEPRAPRGAEKPGGPRGGRPARSRGGRRRCRQTEYLSRAPTPRECLRNVDTRAWIFRPPQGGSGAARRRGYCRRPKSGSCRCGNAMFPTEARM